MNRRRFLAGTAAAAALSAGAARGRQKSDPGDAPPVILFVDPKDPVVAAPPAQHALGRLEAALNARSMDVRRCAPAADEPPGAFRITVSGPGATPALVALGPVRRGKP